VSSTRNEASIRPWRIGSILDLSRSLCRLFKGAHYVLPRDHAYQLTIGTHHGKTPSFEAHHQLKNSCMRVHRMRSGMIA